jgi:putative drug exporter of the RND superfamily
MSVTADTVNRSRSRFSLLLRAYARLIVGLRWIVLACWVAGAVVVLMRLPAIGNNGEDLSQLVSTNNPAVQTELRSADKFGYSLLSRVAIVQYNAHGLPAPVMARAIVRARESVNARAGSVRAAVPVPNAALRGVRQPGTTIVTYLFVSPDLDFGQQTASARQYVAEHFRADDDVVGVTGSIPARVEQSDIVLSSLNWLEAATVAAVFLIVAFAFRTLLAPVAALAVAGIAVLFTLHVGGALAARYDIAVPQEAQPLLVALLLGVVTDYAVFYLSAARAQLEVGADRLTAARWATAQASPIIAIAGIIAAAGTGALIVAGSPTFRAFGPGMGLAVLIGMIVTVTLMPALLGILGSALFWTPRRKARTAAPDGPVVAPATRWSRMLTRPAYSMIVLVACVGGLLWAATPARHLTLGLSFIQALPGNDPARTAADRAEAGFAKGILSPTEILVEGAHITGNKPQLAALEKSIARESGIAAVIGPTDVTIPQLAPLLSSKDGATARYLLVLSDDPLGAKAVATMSRLQRDLPGLAAAAGLGGARVSIDGDTAITAAIVDQTVHDLSRIAIAALAANLLFLMLYLRAALAPLVLLGCSLLAIAATLGLTVWLFEGTLGDDGITFYVPFAAAVVLISLGSDYNIFGIGPAWKEAQGRPLREALAVTLPQSARAIRIAAFTLAASFGLLALIPLQPFRELAFALSVGILLDAFVVRSLLAPAVLSVIGSASQWPGRRLVRRRSAPASAAGDEIVAVKPADEVTA